MFCGRVGVMHICSLSAYDQVKKTLGIREAQVLGVLETAPIGLTGGEIAERLGRHPYVVRPRITGLVEKGLAIDTGQNRINQAGKRETVWRRWTLIGLQAEFGF